MLLRCPLAVSIVSCELFFVFHQFCYKNDKVIVDGKQVSFDGATLINSIYNYLNSCFSINEKNYEKYREFQLIEYDKIIKQLNERRRNLQHDINKITNLRDSFVRNYISRSTLWTDETQEKVYTQEVEKYNEQIWYLEDQLNKLWITHRNTNLEFDGFIKYLSKLAKAYDKWSYVRKRKITTLLFSNIIVTKEKQLIFKAKPWLEDLFIKSHHADRKDFERLKEIICKIEFNTTRSILQASYAQNREWFLTMYTITKEQEVLYWFDQI